MLDFLEGFEKRMQVVAVAASIVGRKNTNIEIEGWFEKDELDNLFFSLLVYIMEQTLKENDECTINNIADFLSSILKDYQKNLSFPQITRLAEYMVKDILQNKGSIKSFGTMSYEEGWHQVNIRLISDKITDDNRIVYQLTDQGYDFLFRTKEVDKELDFKLEQMKLKELLRRKNYKHALRQSRDLIAMLRQKKRELEEFIYRVRQNIHTINRGEHERLLHETYSLIDEEYEGMLTLKTEVVRDEERITREIEESINVDEMLKNALDNLTAIKRNLQIIINEQRNLIAERFNMNEIYEETILSSFYMAAVKRFDFEKEVMLPLEQMDEKNIGNLLKLMMPLMHPMPEKKLNLLLLYQNQGKLKDSEEEESGFTDELLEEDKVLEEIRIKNQINYRIISQLLKYASTMATPFCFSQYFQHISEDAKGLRTYTQDKRIFLIVLKLYEIGVVGIEQWKNREQDEAVTKANGEFDLNWTLLQLEQEEPDFYGLKSLTIERGNEMFETQIEACEADILKSKIEMNDLLFIPMV